MGIGEGVVGRREVLSRVGVGNGGRGEESSYHY